MMGSFAEPLRMRFCIGSIPKRVVDALSSHAFGFCIGNIPKSVVDVLSSHAIGLEIVNSTKCEE